MKETKQFQTESKELLSLMINSIYSNSEVFLRELLSNASDAIDKYRYLSASNGDKYPASTGEIFLSFDKKKRTITLTDNGIGMNKEDLEKNLGTIARSGSKEFMEQFKSAKEKGEMNIIGRFGVGFYSAFIVADKVTVVTKKYGEEAFRFESDGLESYSIEEAKLDVDHGTQITMHLRKNEDDVDYDSYLAQWKLESLIKKYSDYLAYPIKMEVSSSVQDVDEEGKPIEGKYHDVNEIKTINSMVPLWKKKAADLTDEECATFYKEKCGDYEDPLERISINVEGLVSYRALLFIPKHAPYNFYSESYEKGLDLYARGIFVQEKCKELIPDWFKFVKGVVDSEDFSLNISREMLQKSPILTKIADSIEKKIVDKLKQMKEKDEGKYFEFYKAFGDNLKFGIYQTYGAKKDSLQDLLLFHSLKEDKLISLKQYKEAMKKGQKSIYFASGKNLEAIKNLPQLEKYRKEEIDVLLLDHDIDEFVIMMMADYDKTPFKSVSDGEEEIVSEEKKKEVEEKTISSKRLLDTLKESLSEKVSDVVLSTKLVDAPVCISTRQGMSLNMENTLAEQAKFTQQEAPKAEKVLEINPDHPLFAALSAIQDSDDEVKEFGSVLYDEALMLEGFEVEDKGAFVKKLNSLIVKALNK